jgi:hypothetical protein
LFVIVTFAPYPTVSVFGATPEPAIVIAPPEADPPPVIGSVGEYDDLLHDAASAVSEAPPRRGSARSSRELGSASWTVPPALRWSSGGASRAHAVFGALRHGARSPSTPRDDAGHIVPSTRGDDARTGKLSKETLN